MVKYLLSMLIIGVMSLLAGCDLENEQDPQPDFVTIQSPIKYGGKDLYCVPGSDRLFLLADSLYVSDDDAQSWKSVKMPAHAVFDTTKYVGYSSIFFTDSLTGYLCTWPERILKTSDGGSTWFDQNFTAGHGINSMYFINSLHGFAVGGWETILETFDGGINWILKHQYGLSDLYSYRFMYVFFPDNQHGLINGQNSGGALKMWLTDNLGADWTFHQSSIEQQASITNFAVYNDSTYYFSSTWSPGCPSTLYRSTNYGLDWIAVTGDFASTTSDIAIYKNRYICVGSYDYIRISDHEKKWLKFGADNGNTGIHSVCINRNGYCFAINSKGIIYKSTKPINEMLK